jgi:hypothetical protein
MASAVEQLIELVDEQDPYTHSQQALLDLQLQAVNERFIERRDQVAVLRRRAVEQGSEGIKCAADLVPLLFSHTNYKSYPSSFLEKGQWDLMTRWLGTLSAVPVNDVNLAGVSDVDQWVQRLHEAGHYVFASSGTTGNCSFLNQTSGDRAFRLRGISCARRVMTAMMPAQDRAVFFSAPRQGNTGIQEYQQLYQLAFARPGQAYYLFDGGASVHELNRMAAVRRALAAGTIEPDQLANAEHDAVSKRANMSVAIERYVRDIGAHRHERCLIMGSYSMLYAVVEAMRAAGIKPGEFHHETVVITGGGLKGAKDLPVDFLEQTKAFFGLPKRNFSQEYAMGETSSPWPACEHGHYHVPPWMVLLILDKDGDRLLEPIDGRVEGRAAVFDVSIESRWGGVISGDRVTVNHRPCECGRNGSTVTAISRYTDLPEGDDKLTCAGTINSYVRGLVGETA